jgi:hypothetical protein
MELVLAFEDNGRAHDDLVLTVDGVERRSDSYYLALDRGLLPQREDAAKVREVLARLLEQWIAAVKNLTEGQVVYLPWDLSDQGSQWFECRLADGRLLVRQGSSGVEGWSFFATNITEPQSRVARDFQPDTRPRAVTREEFIQLLEDSLLRAAGPPPAATV